jgi:hypothetical protein
MRTTITAPGESSYTVQDLKRSGPERCYTPQLENAMSKGSPLVIVRMPAKLIDEMDRVMHLANHRRRGEPLTRSTFVRAAVKEKLAHMHRSRTYRAKRRDNPPTCGPTNGNQGSTEHPRQDDGHKG